MYSLQYGKPIHAESLVSKMLEIDPMSAVNYVLLGLIQWMENKIDFAISSFKKSNNLDPKLIYSKLWLIYGLAWKGLKEQAIEQINQVVDDQTDRRKDVIFINWCMFFKYALLGKKSKALEILDKETEDFFYNIPELLWFGICNFTLIDEIDEALKWLERAINWGWINYPFIAEGHPLLMKLRNEKRFLKLLGRVKEEWENYDV
jgi:tetratricopeptide (TPR) repeat protein